MDIRGVDSGISNVLRSKITIDFYMLCSFMEHVIEIKLLCTITVSIKRCRACFFPMKQRRRKIQSKLHPMTKEGEIRLHSCQIEIRLQRYWLLVVDSDASYHLQTKMLPDRDVGRRLLTEILVTMGLGRNIWAETCVCRRIETEITMTTNRRNHTSVIANYAGEQKFRSWQRGRTRLGSTIIWPSDLSLHRNEHWRRSPKDAYRRRSRETGGNNERA